MESLDYKTEQDSIGRITLDDLFVAPETGHRNNDTEVFFPDPSDLDFKQITIKKASSLPIKSEDLLEERKIKEIVSFFAQNPFISINNFKIAEKLFLGYLDKHEVLFEKLARLREEFDKYSSDADRFGKLVMNWSLKHGSIRIALKRSRFKNSKQHISINLNTKLSSRMVVYTQWDTKRRKSELIRSKSPLASNIERDKDSISFDARVWQTFNKSGLTRKDMIKTLECIERNQRNLGAFIAEVNKKDMFHLFSGNLIGNVLIKTDNKDTTFMSFRTNAHQKVDVKITDFASSITLHH